MKFSGKTILITGASAGIGKAVALKIAEDQGHLILASRNEEKLQAVKSEVEAMGASAEVIPTDVADAEQVKSLFLKATEGGRVIDAVFNNAGLGHVRPLDDLTPEEIKQMIDVNIYGMMIVAKYAIEVMRRQEYGHLMFTSSLAGLITLPQWSVYVASKWAITAFADSIRPEVKEFGVKVTTLHPGAIKTEFFDEDKADIDISKMGEAIPASDVADLVYDTYFTDKKRIIIPAVAKSIAFLKRYLPFVGDAMLDRMTQNVDYHEEDQAEDEPDFSYISKAPRKEE